MLNATRGSPLYDTPMAHVYRNNYPLLSNYDGQATLIRVIPHGGSFDGDGEQVTRTVRKVANMPQFAPYGFYIISDVSELLDGMDEVYIETPRMMLTTVVVVVFCLSLFAFRSLILSVRLLLTIGVTMFWVSCSTVVLFQEILGQSGIYWIVPIACAPIVCGLALDYDTLLISRIYEYRYKGYSTTASVFEGLKKTGGIITTAGLIMMVAFSSLMFSSEMVN